MRSLGPPWVGELTVNSKASQCGEVFSSPSLVPHVNKNWYMRWVRLGLQQACLVKPDCLKATEMVCLWSGAPKWMWKCRVTQDIILMLRYKWWWSRWLTRFYGHPRGEEELWKLGSPSLIASPSWYAVALRLRQIKSRL